MINRPSYPKVKLSQLINFKCTSKYHRQYVTVRKLPKGPVLELPKEFQIDKECAWCIGFYIAEGSNLESSIGISNGYVPFVLRFRDFIDKFFEVRGIKWYAYLRTKNLHTKTLKIRYGHIANINLKIQITKLATNDNLELRINNVVLTKIFQNLVTMGPKFILLDKQLILEFIKGYEVGDGSINVRKNCLHDVNITVKNKNVKNLLKLMFHKLYKIKLNERITKGAFEISYSNVKGMMNLILDGHFSEYPQQWHKLIAAYKNKEFIRSHLRYWRLLTKPKDIRTIAIAAERSHWSVREALNTDTNLGIVRYTLKRTNKPGPPKKIYSLTDKGKRLIEMLG